MRSAKNRNLILLALALAVAMPAAADDSDIFLSDAIQPNVVILLDSSGSMSSPPGGGRSGTPKIDTAKAVVTNLFANVTGVRFGLFKFNDGEDGAELLAPVGASTAELIAAVNDIEENGSTPLGRSLDDVQDYFLGLYGGNGGGLSSGDSDEDEDEDSDEDEDGDDDEAYPSPIEYECQLNYVIVVTDGLPNGEPEELVSDVAASLFSTDHSSSLAQVQNVIVHTVGFDIAEGTALLTETAQNGGGSFFTASTGAQLEQALQDALEQIFEDLYSFAAPQIPSTSANGGTLAYMASFEPAPSQPFWKGHLKAYQRDADGLIPLGVDNTPLPSAMVWNAATLLNTKAASARTIYTAIGTTRHDFTDSNVSITQGMLGVLSSSLRTRVINFVRGVDTYDEDADGNTTEERAWKLGDIFHSAPVLVFPPPLRTADSAYAAFKTANQNRPTIVLAGANDGMIHAFRASDGEELWAFIPPNLLSTLKSMTVALGQHAYYVDLSPVVADVKLAGTWKTIALIGERRGGNRYIALDITDTTNPGYLWSFTSAQLGETWSIPAIGKIKLTGGVEKAVAFVGGGYNTASNNALGKAFFVIDLETGATLWEYYNTGTADAAKMNFSLAGPPTAADLDLDGFTDRVYAADVGGQLWKFDVSAVGTLASGVVTNWTGKRLFDASPSQTHPPAAGEYYPAQGLYGGPALAFDPYGSLWVFFGSGDRNHPNHTSANRFYGIKDNTTMANGAALTEASLVDVTSSEPGVSQGWFIQLSTDEKVLDGAEVFHSVVYFTTYTPADTEVCGAAYGTARLYAVNMEAGQPTEDWDNDGDKERSEDVGTGIPSKPKVMLDDSGARLITTTTSEEVTDEPLPDSDVRVRYWREVF